MIMKKDEPAIIQPDRKLYYVDEWLPAKRLSLLAGSSAAGKTTLLFQMFEAWLNRERFLGQATMGQDKGSVYYVSLDHEKDEVEELLDRAGIDRKLFNWRALGDEPLNPLDVMTIPKGTAIFAIDGGEMMLKACKHSDFDTVQTLIRDLKVKTKESDCATILLLGSPKLKKNEEYMMGRERVLGSSAWGRLVSTVFNIGITNPGAAVGDTRRTLFVYPRHTPACQVELDFTPSGRLVTLAQATANKEDRLKFLQELQSGQKYTRKQMLEIGARYMLSPSTVDKTLGELVAQKVLNHSYNAYTLPGLEQLLLGNGITRKDGNDQVNRQGIQGDLGEGQESEQAESDTQSGEEKA